MLVLSYVIIYDGWNDLRDNNLASELKENGDTYTALLYWFFGLTALAGAFRFRIASIIEKLTGKNNE